MVKIKMRYALDEPGAPVKIACFAKYLSATTLDFSAYFSVSSIRRYTGLQTTVSKMGHAFQEGYMNLVLLYGFLRGSIPRYEDACQFPGALESLESVEPDKLPSLLWMASSLALVKGIVGMRELDPQFGFEGIKEYVELREIAGEKGLGSSVPVLADESSLDTGVVEQEMRAYLAELTVSVRLRAIKDPFERSRELAKEISKDWPPGLSAVDAIREQRERDWNRAP